MGHGDEERRQGKVEGPRGESALTLRSEDRKQASLLEPEVGFEVGFELPPPLVREAFPPRGPSFRSQSEETREH